MMVIDGFLFAEQRRANELEAIRSGANRKAASRSARGKERAFKSLRLFRQVSLHSAPNPHIATSERTRQEDKLAFTRNIRLEQPQHSRPTPASSLWKSAH